MDQNTLNESPLRPFVRDNLDILFVGLNPANTSSRKGHYFSTRPNFWNQLYNAGLISEEIDMNTADTKVFGTSDLTFNHWQFGITDLVNSVAESDSTNVKPTDEHCKQIEQTILTYKPKVVVLMHSKVLKFFVKRYLGKQLHNYGLLGKLLDGCETVFYNVPFPHGNAITDKVKTDIYKEIKEYLDNRKEQVKIPSKRSSITSKLSTDQAKSKPNNNNKITYEQFKGLIDQQRQVVSVQGKRYSCISVVGDNVRFIREGHSNYETICIEDLYEMFCKEPLENISTPTAKKYITKRVQSPAVAMVRDIYNRLS